jgi:hypothetical protein
VRVVVRGGLFPLKRHRQTRRELAHAIFECIEAFYNEKEMHLDQLPVTHGPRNPPLGCRRAMPYVAGP